MNSRYHRISFLHIARAALLASLLLRAVDSNAQVPQLPASAEHSSHLTQPIPVRIENVIHIVGLVDKPGATGELGFDEKAMTFGVHDHSTAIPLRSILAFSILRGDRALISGAKGTLAQAAPYGIGFAVAMTRPSVETLTLFYSDSYRAIRGCILVLPKDTGERVVSAFTGVGLSPTDYPKTGGLKSSEPQRESGSQMTAASSLPKPSVEVTLPPESVGGIPSAFSAAVYEDLMEQLTQSGLFAHVWRAGDTRRTPDTLVLHVDIEDWKKGSARGRGLGPFTGATVMKSSVTLEDRSGRRVFQGKVGGAKRMKGESLEVTNSLAKHVRKALEKTPDLQPNKQGGE